MDIGKLSSGIIFWAQLQFPRFWALPNLSTTVKGGISTETFSPKTHGLVGVENKHLNLPRSEKKKEHMVLNKDVPKLL